MTLISRLVPRSILRSLHVLSLSGLFLTLIMVDTGIRVLSSVLLHLLYSLCCRNQTVWFSSHISKVPIMASFVSCVTPIRWALNDCSIQNEPAGPNSWDCENLHNPASERANRKPGLDHRMPKAYSWRESMLPAAISSESTTFHIHLNQVPGSNWPRDHAV